jgi:flagellar motor switch protein FliM
MSEVLEQDEIDALLNSTEADALAGAVSEIEQTAQADAADAPAAPGGADAYDFKRPERVNQNQIAAIASMHEVFARDLGATYSGLLRTNVDVRAAGARQLTYHEFIQSLPNPTCFVILQAPPLERQMCLEFSPSIVYPFIDRLLGGDNSNPFIPQRPLTSIEWRLVNRIVERTLAHLSEAWENLVEVRFAAVETESNPLLVQIAAPTDVVVSISFEISLGEAAGTMSLCVPFNTIESVLGEPSRRSWLGQPKPATDAQQKRLLRNLVKSPVDLTAYLGQTTIRLSELRDLRPGDLIQLEKRTDQELILRIAGRNKFAGKVGQFRGHRALCITRRADVDEVL